jgi:hypothetical protein
MARFKDEQKVVAAFQPYLQPGDQVQHFAYGVKQPSMLLMLPLFLLAILPGAIAVALLTKEYIVALTGQKFIALRFSSGKITVKEVLEYYPQETAAPGVVKTSKGGLFTHIRINHPEKPFVAKFHRMGMPNNKPHAEAIVDRISGAPALQQGHPQQGHPQQGHPQQGHPQQGQPQQGHPQQGNPPYQGG